MTNTKAIVKVAFRTALAEEKLQEVSSGDKPVIAEVPGLIRKIYHVNPENGVFGAVYHFENEEAAESYMQSPMIKDLANRYRIVPGTLQVEKVKVVFVLAGNNTSSHTNKIVSGDWKAITTEKVVKGMLDSSKKRPVLLFKNSNKCPVGRSILRRLDGLLQANLVANVELYILDVISDGDISNKVAAMFAVQHASPQVLLIKNGSCIYHARQTEIDGIEIIEKVNAINHQFSHKTIL